MKKASIAIIFGMFLTFLFYQLPKSSGFEVLKINSPTEIFVDINKNGVADKDELIGLKVQSFSTKPSEAQSKLAKKLKISDEDAMGLGFLAENFAKETLAEKQVKLKNNNSEVFVGNKNYKNMLLSSGFAVESDCIVPLSFKKNLEKVHKLNLIIFNNKSHKYHKLGCKYGLLAHNSQILPASQLPQDAKACKFCHSNNAKYKKDEKSFKKYKFEDEIPNIISPPTTYQAGNIKMFLTDMTKVLKPSNSCNTAICSALVNEINSAQSSIDFAIYGYSKIPAIEQALVRAQQRGVKIRFVYDLDDCGNNIYPDTLYLTRVLTNNRADYQAPIMHDKFFIFDNKTVMTGSANISNTDMSGYNSNAIVLINSTQIANIYSQEFEQMYGGKFHKQKSKQSKHISGTNDDKVVLDCANFAVYFSPEDKPLTTQVIPLIDNAKKYIYIPAFLITHKGLADSLVNASKRGVAVKVILDATNTHTSSSKMKMLREAGIQVKTENFAGKLHSKSIIIDDTYTVIGSMNFSRSGEGANDENLIIIKDRNSALFYKTFFQYLWKRIPDKWLTHNARAESPDSIGSCSDGIDNDFDGKIDKADESCVPHKSK